MASIKFVTVGYEIPGEHEYIPLDSDVSLLDADVILIQPEIPSSYHSYRETEYQGKPTLGQSGSFKMVQQTAHWRSEIKTALEHGKTVIVFLAKPEEAWVYTGEKQYSGTGRNQKVTNIVKPVSSYDMFPVNLGKIVPRQGREIRMASDASALASYWSEFKSASPYQLYLDGCPLKAALLTKAGDKAVGVMAKVEGGGHLIMVPPVQFDEDEFLTESEEGEDEEGQGDDESGGPYWNEKGIAFGARLVAALLRLDQELRGDRGRTPPPDWAALPEFRLAKEVELETKLADLRRRMTELRLETDTLTANLVAEGGLRRLLFATGADLEEALLDALRLLGYTAENIREGDSEFDAVFVSPEGERYIGEAEGKDNKALNIDKLSQLERNIQEDFAREEVSAPARGVLFANAHRLLPPTSRPAFFTDKCLSGAARSRIALVRTPDLFAVSRYLRENDDPEFARACRAAIASGEGTVVAFPAMPTAPVKDKD